VSDEKRIHPRTGRRHGTTHAVPDVRENLNQERPVCGHQHCRKDMNTTHVGKIGRLPKSIRDMLGQRIENG